MELADKMLVDKFLPENPELRRLIEAHERYEKQILNLSGRARLMSGEQQELRMLKKRKLRGRDRIEEILRGYRNQSLEG